MRLCLTAIALSLAVGACGEAPAEPVETAVPKHDRDAAWTPPEGLPDFAQRQDPNPGVGHWINRLEPQPSEACNFSAKPPTDRPRDLVLTAWSGNLDLYTPPDTLEHRRGEGFIESEFMKARSVVAVRQGMDDIWIQPIGDNVVLFIGQDEFTCRREAPEG